MPNFTNLRITESVTLYWSKKQTRNLSFTEALPNTESLPGGAEKNFFF